MNERRKIMIVDDSLFHQAVLRRMLETIRADPSVPFTATYTIITAASGQEALQKARSEKPDLILLDIHMPGMSGFDVLSELKESPETKQISVIIVSGLSDDANEEKGFALGAVDYVTKPYKQSIVLARIKTHLKILEQMRLIEQLSMMDMLTNIPNRRCLDSRLSAEWGRAIRENTTLSILMIDIDHFKLFNDTYGHQQGDIVLQAVANTLNTATKRSADLAGRWGGEEFVVLLPNTLLEGALHIAEQIRKTIEYTQVPRLDHGKPLNVTVSVGAASKAPAAGDAVDELISHVDKALYTAKETGRNRVCF